jgi:hypothetical protein
VLVLQLMQEGGLAAVGVRDEQQGLKPLKVNANPTHTPPSFLPRPIRRAHT